MAHFHSQQYSILSWFFFSAVLYFVCACGQVHGAVSYPQQVCIRQCLSSLQQSYFSSFQIKYLAHLLVHSLSSTRGSHWCRLGVKLPIQLSASLLLLDMSFFWALLPIRPNSSSSEAEGFPAFSAQLGSSCCQSWARE